MLLLWCREDEGKIRIQLQVRDWTLELHRDPEEVVGACCRRLAIKLATSNHFSQPITAIDFLTAEDESEMCDADDENLEKVLIRANSLKISYGEAEFALLNVYKNHIGFDLGLNYDQKLIEQRPVIMSCSRHSDLLLCEWFRVDSMSEVKRLVPKVKGKYYGAFGVTVSGGMDPRREESGAVKIGEGFRFRVEGAEIGCFVVARVSARVRPDTPSSSGDETNDCEMNNYYDHVYALGFNNERVINAPRLSAWQKERRDNICSSRDKTETLRVMSWNILAPVYADSDLSRSATFSYCSNEHMDFHYRKVFIADELERYDADIISLQEVGKDVYRSLIMSGFEHEYESRLFLKASSADEGLAIMIKKSRFRIRLEELLMFKKRFMESPDYAFIRNHIETHWGDGFLEKVIKRMSCVVGVMFLESRFEPKRKCVVVNTHFFWHPNAGHIRTLQCYFAINEVLKLIKLDSGSNGEYDLIIFNGDLNANEGTATLDLIKQGKVGADHETWLQAELYGLAGNLEAPEEVASTYGASKEEGPKEANPSTPKPSWKGIELTLNHPIKLAEFDDMPFTNITRGFKAVLDWMGTNMKQKWGLKGVPQVCENERPVPSETPTGEHAGREPMPIGHVECAECGLPSEDFPSDHIPLVADFFLR